LTLHFAQDDGRLGSLTGADLHKKAPIAF